MPEIIKEETDKAKDSKKKKKKKTKKTHTHTQKTKQNKTLKIKKWAFYVYTSRFEQHATAISSISHNLE